MKSIQPALAKLEKLHNILVARATGGSADNDEYILLRREFISSELIKSRLPQFVIDCRNLGDFWDYIKSKFSSYAERRNYLREEFSSLFRWLESSSNLDFTVDGDSFKYQFPLGIPFGLTKPNMAVIPDKGGQTIYFEDSETVGVIRENVYPNLTFSKLESCLHGTPMGDLNLKEVLVNMYQTKHEQRFFEFYAHYYDIWTRDIPVLIPQAWIQWHSSTKQELRSRNSSYVDELYRVDFVAFWENKRFAILVDDIGHYARKNYSYWNADEEKYSMRLKEDRKLRNQKWEVFRVSNWEIRNGEFLRELSADLLEFIGISSIGDNA